MLENNKREKLRQLNLLNELFVTYEDEKFMNFTRFTKNKFFDLLSKVRVKITKINTYYEKVVSPEIHLALTLRNFAKGNSMTTLNYEFRVGLSTVSELLKETAQTILTFCLLMFLLFHVRKT